MCSRKIEAETMKKKIVPEGLELYPFQRDGVRRVLKERKKRWLMALDCGTGKTPVSIVITNAWHIKNKSRVLIIVPAVVKLNWLSEFKKWDVWDRSVSIVKNGKDRPGTDVVIISEALISNTVMNKWLSSNFGIVIYDEAHHVKNWRSSRTKAFFKLIDKIENVLLLTGTPMTKSVMDLHPLCCCCEPGKWGKYKDFGFAYSTPIHNGFSLEYVGVKNIKELKKNMGRFMIRIFKKDVLKDLPDKTYSTIPVEIDSDIAEDSMNYIEYAERELGVVSHTFTKPNNDEEGDPEHIAVMRKKLGIAKISKVLEFLEQFGDEPVVVFCAHRFVVDGIVKGLSKKGRSVCTITGATPSKDKDRHVKEFQAGKYQFIICNIVAAGVGITLTRSSNCVFAELSWMPAEISQSIDRLHRIGQENAVSVYFLVGRDSIDERVVEVLREKMKLIKETVGIG